MRPRMTLRGLPKPTHLLAMISGLLLALLMNDARAEVPTQMVGPVTVRNLRAHAGKTLHVFFVSGRPATIGVSGQTVHSYALMRPPVRVTIGRNGEATIPVTSVPRIVRNVRPFNYMVLEVTSSDVRELYLRNQIDENGRVGYSYPFDPRATEAELRAMSSSAFAHDLYGFVAKARIEQSSGNLTISQGVDF